MNNRKKKYAVLLCVCVFAAIMAAAAAVFGRGHAGNSANLALHKGVIATSDSTENDALTAYKAIDGDDSTLSSRWSSENNWEDASHYIQLEFPTEISVSFVVLKWERRNAVSYALEGSGDGERWQVLQSFDTAPETKNQEIALEEAVTVRFLRLSTYEVSVREEDYSNLYQNISLYEFEVYEDKPAAYRLEQAQIGYREDGGRYLIVPDPPEGYEVAYLGADYEQIIAADGNIYNTIQDKDVTVGFRVCSAGDESDAREIAQVVRVPAYPMQDVPETGNTEHGSDGFGEENAVQADAAGCNPCPEVIPALAEWRGKRGNFKLSGKSRVIVEEGSGLRKTAELFADGYQDVSGIALEITDGTVEDAKSGDIYLGYGKGTDGLGREGYLCHITDKCIVEAESDIGVHWGSVTLLQILQQEGTMPQGEIRDYPRCQVRGFGIDVARKAVSMDMLYAMMETMSLYKMNDLTIHLNDNVILSTSGLADSVERAMTAGSAFRLESDVVNEDGQRLTSSEYAYTKEEFAQFIDTAKTYGVTVVPEIDTPAHSLSVTKLFPEYALTTRPESVDQIDLGNTEAVELVKSIWKEALADENGAFRHAEIVNIGMDEYYGDGEQYRVYLTEIADLVQEEGKTVRVWGSLSNMEGQTMPDPENLQMNLWSTVWADPREMYEAGYSLINMQNNHLYVIPGGGYDRLDVRELYENWEPNKFYDHSILEIIPAYSPQMLGAVYMMWNDMSGSMDVGISEYDLYERFEQPLPVLAGKLWGSEITQTYEEFSGLAERTVRGCFGIRGAENRIYDEKVGLEPYYEVDIRVRMQKSAKRKQQVIARSGSPYGEWAFYAVEEQTGCVGFAREGRVYTWDYELPYDEWVELKVVGEPCRTTLYVNGVSVGTLGNETPFEEYATFVFPVEYIGEETGAFAGEAELTVTLDE